MRRVWQILKNNRYFYVAIITVIIFVGYSINNNIKRQNSVVTPQSVIRVKQWFHHYGSVMPLITKDLGKIQSDASQKKSSTTLISDCQKLSRDILVAKKEPPIPNASVQRDWTRGLTAYNQGAHNCVQGLKSKNVNKIKLVPVDFRKGTNFINAATAKLKQIYK